MADVEHVQQHIGVDGFFERRLEAGDEIVRQIADEADGVAEHDLGAALQFPGAGFGVERREELVVGIGAGGGERVEQRALAGVGVADDADGEMLPSAFGDEPRLALLDLGDSFLQIRDAFADEPAIGFELRFTRPARADAHPAPPRDRSRWPHICASRG